ncbi:MAG: hypothetical protein NTV22_14370 [bacterium]|nr:hypothetical protein [bacterium]
MVRQSGDAQYVNAERRSALPPPHPSNLPDPHRPAASASSADNSAAAPIAPGTPIAGSADCAAAAAAPFFHCPLSIIHYPFPPAPRRARIYAKLFDNPNKRHKACGMPALSPNSRAAREFTSGNLLFFATYATVTALTATAVVRRLFFYQGHHHCPTLSMLMRARNMKKLLLIVLLASLSLHAEYQITGFGVPVTENFDAFNATNLANWALYTGGTALLTDNGSKNSGARYAYTNSPTERSLGYLPSSSAAYTTNIAYFTNVSANAIGKLVITNYYEQWRIVGGGRTNGYRAYLSIDGSPWSELLGLSYTSGVPAGTTITYGDGNNNRTMKSGTIEALTIPSAAGFQIMWVSDRGLGAGSSQGISIDDLTVVGLVPEPAVLALLSATLLFTRRLFC